jgi:hypothetical protein
VSSSRYRRYVRTYHNILVGILQISNTNCRPNNCPATLPEKPVVATAKSPTNDVFLC